MPARSLLALLVAMSLPTTVRAENAQATLVIQNHRFEPAELEVPAGQKVELRVINEDSTAEEFESNELHREKVVPGAKEVTVFIGPLRAGAYQFFGDFNPKTARGRIIAK